LNSPLKRYRLTCKTSYTGINKHLLWIILTSAVMWGTISKMSLAFNAWLAGLLSGSSSNLYWQKCNKCAERTRKEKHCCQIAKIQQTHKSTISQDNKSPREIQSNTRKKKKLNFNHTSTKSNDIYDKLHHIKFSTIKKTAMLEKDTVPNWDRMWSLNGNDITCSSVSITPQGHSLSSLGIWLHLPVSMANLCDDNLNRVVYTRSRSGILSTFPTY